MTMMAEQMKVRPGGPFKACATPAGAVGSLWALPMALYFPMVEFATTFAPSIEQCWRFNRVISRHGLASVYLWHLSIAT